jgi:hypothetical protein
MIGIFSRLKGDYPMRGGRSGLRWPILALLAIGAAVFWFSHAEKSPQPLGGEAVDASDAFPRENS